MTYIRVHFSSWTDPSDTGGHGTITFQPSGVMTQGASVYTADAQTFPVPPGGAVIQVAANSPGTYYRVRGHNEATGGEWSEAVRVSRADDDEVVLYGHLHRVDPRHKPATPEPPEQWWAEQETIQRQVDHLQQQIDHMRASGPSEGEEGGS